MNKRGLKIFGGCLVASVMVAGTSMADVGSEPVLNKHLDALGGFLNSSTDPADMALKAKYDAYTKGDDKSPEAVLLQKQSNPSSIGVAGVSASMSAGSQSVKSTISRIDSLYQDKLYAAMNLAPEGPAGATSSMSSAVDPGVWGSLIGTTGSQDAIDTKTGFDYTTVGIMFGYDADLGGNTIVGVNASYAQANVDSGFNENTDTDVDTYGISLYLSKDLTERVHGLIGVGYLMGDMDTDRTVTGIGIAKSSGDIDTYTAYGNLAYDYISGSMLITPNVGFNYSSTSADGFTETGIGALGMVVEDIDTDLFSTSVGSKLQYFVSDALSVKGRANWIHEFSGDLQSTTRARFNYTGSTFFTTDGIDLDTDRFNLGFGVEVNMTSNVTFDLDYDAELADGFDSHTGTAKFKYNF